ncbi:MAG: hypothetical protein OXB93_07125, partial [Cytophagales bacterium]|nr:hypothetical protein [Cytophagales bacterium]
QKRWKNLRKQFAKNFGKKYTPNANAGMAASFLSMALAKVKPGGRIGYVLPLTAASDTSWQKTRSMIEQEFEDILVITGKKGRVSDETAINEMLLVATRRTKPKPKANLGSPVYCVNIKETPDSLGVAGEMARAISPALSELEGSKRSIRMGKSEIGHVLRFEGKEGKPWSHARIKDTDLALISTRLVEEGLLQDFETREEISLPCPIRRIEKIFKVGPTESIIGHVDESKRIRGAFRFVPLLDEEPYGYDRSLWSADSKHKNTLIVHPTHKGESYSLKNKKGMLVSTESHRNAIRKSISTCFYAQYMGWASQKLLIASTHMKVMGGRAWTSLSHADDRVLRMMSLWGNSILGMLINWTQGSRTQSGRFMTRIKGIRQMPCPDFSQLSEEALNLAEQRFKALSQLELMPAAQCHADQNRHKIDEAVIEILALPAEQMRGIVKKLRWTFCAEDSVHGGNKACLNLLEKAERPS